MIRFERLMVGLICGQLGIPLSGAAQACTVLPTTTNAVWFGGIAEWGGPTLQRRGQVSINVIDVVDLEWGVSWGGYEASRGGSEARIRATTGLGRSDRLLCPYVEVRNINYRFRRGFDLDYGDVEEAAYQVGVGFGGDALDAVGVSLRWQVNVGGYYRVWDMRGRRLIITDDDAYPEAVHRLDHSFHLSLLGALSLQWRGALVHGPEQLNPGRFRHGCEAPLGLLGWIGYCRRTP